MLVSAVPTDIEEKCRTEREKKEIEPWIHRRWMYVIGFNTLNQ